MEVKDLKPALIWQCFDAITKVPRPSTHEEQIRKFLLDFAAEHNLEARTDKVGNVAMSKGATPGYENAPTVILQAHMDMVAEKNNDVQHDFLKDPIETYIDGDWVRARGTTLGADNGIGMAAGLAVMLDNTLEHGPIECLFTVNEEIGLEGAQNLGKDLVKGTILINLDSEDDGEIFVGCAGGIDTTAYFTYPRSLTPENFHYMRVSVKGLLGGHSGSDINAGRANANKVMGEFMDRIQKLMPLCLTSLSGGTKDNAIPRSCQATLVAMGIQLERINAVAEELQAEIREKYDEPDAIIQAFDVDALGGNGLSTQATAKVIGLLCAAPNGGQARSKDIEGLVQTSLNMGITKLGERFNVTFSVRSSVNSEKEDLLEKLKGLAEFFEGSYSQSGEYPAWEFRKNSVLRDTMVRIYREMFGKEPQVLAIHAGLECGLLGEKLPGLDCVSIGPQMHDIHTSREKLDIASTERTWNFLLEVLKNL